MNCSTSGRRNVAVFGSTGSIGRSTLEVADRLSDRIRVTALSAHSQLEAAVAQAHQFRPRWLIATAPELASQLGNSQLPPETELLVGGEALERVAADPSIETLVAAIVGIAGLRSTWAALEAGKRVALANKETLVVAGPLVVRLAEDRGAQLLPVDSEHSAIFQALQAGRREEVRRVVLTASGGPFRDHTPAQLADVTIAQALAHPTWDMGTKITIDSATMMNKALEIVEARWLFNLAPEEIQVVIHPQSVVHSFVEFVDGSVMAQLSPPDMKLPIQYALTYPDRCPGPATKMPWDAVHQLDFLPASPERYPALGLGLEVARVGGTAGAVLNAANEAAVDAFIEGQLSFAEIVPACRSVLEHHDYDPQPALDDLLRLDLWARQEMTRWVRT